MTAKMATSRTRTSRSAGRQAVGRTNGKPIRRAPKPAPKPAKPSYTVADLMVASYDIGMNLPRLAPPVPLSEYNTLQGTIKPDGSDWVFNPKVDPLSAKLAGRTAESYIERYEIGRGHRDPESDIKWGPAFVWCPQNPRHQRMYEKIVAEYNDLIPKSRSAPFRDFMPRDPLSNFTRKNEIGDDEPHDRKLACELPDPDEDDEEDGQVEVDKV